MDIRKWLQETVLPEQPVSPTRLEQSGPDAPPHPTAPERDLRAGRRRKRSTSDSSLLRTRTIRREPSLVERRAAIVDSGDDSAYSDAHHPPVHSSESSSSSQQYARKPRRKTRPERYEPTSKGAKGRGTQVNRHRKDESKKKKHSSRRKKADKPGAGLVQSFHAKNVPKDRLTLKPPEKLGLFNRGRVSSPVRGRGLPDLVFSEMKFLQKHKDQPEAAPHAGLPKKKRKKDHAQAKQEEISAYFTSVRPALVEKDVNAQAKESPRRQSLPRDSPQQRERSSLADNAIPTIEIPDKTSYLGFGSRGPRHESGSYISWSESIRAPSVAPIRVQTGPVLTSGQLGSIYGGKDSVGAGGDGVQSYAPRSESKHLTDGSGGCFQVSSMAPPERPVFRSNSSPQRTRSPWPPRSNDSSGRRQTLETVASPSSMPAAIPVRSEPRRERRPPTRMREVHEPATVRHSPYKPELQPRLLNTRDDVSNGSIATNDDPQTSSSLGRLLLECNTVFNERRHEAAASGVPNMAPGNPESIQRNYRRLSGNLAAGRIRSLPTVRFAGVETYPPQVSMYEYAGPGIYEEQERRTYPVSQPDVADDGMLQYSFVAGGEEEVNERHAYDDLDYTYDELDWRPSREDDTLSLGLDDGTLEAEYIPPYEAKERETRLPQPDDVVARGFWRPHKLY